MSSGKSPIRLEWGPGGLCLNVLLAPNLVAKPGAAKDDLWLIVRRGIESVWRTDFPLDSELEQAFIQFIQRRQPESIGLAQAYLQDLKIGADRASGDGEPALARLNLDIKLEFLPPARSPSLVLLKSIFQGKRRPVRTYLRPLQIFPSHVGSPLWRRFWGIFRYGQIESLGFNWAPYSPGYMVLDSKLSPARLARVAAHELGHILGLGDAYAAGYRFYWEHPGSAGYLMNSNGNLAQEEFVMLLRAHSLGKAQFFPRKFKAKLVLRGLKSELAYYGRKLKKLGSKI